ncbi:MAG: hypothetical protein ACOC1Z_01340 [Cyanobacteriota bacterium]
MTTLEGLNKNENPLDSIGYWLLVIRYLFIYHWSLVTVLQRTNN